MADRVRTVADEAFGPFPVQTAEEALTAIELGIFEMRQRFESVRAESKHWCDHATKLVSDVIAADERAATAPSELVEMRSYATRLECVIAQAHANECPTVREDGECDGCYMSEALDTCPTGAE